MKNKRAVFGFLSLVSPVVLFNAFLLLVSPPLAAQSTYGSIAGTITDTAGGAIADAQVTLTNLGTAEKRMQPTGSDGLYSFVNLFPGRYKIEVEKTGFKRFTRPEVVVEVNQSVRIDATLQVGDVTQVVEVSGETPLLQSETSSLGQVVEQRKTNELPLNGRNIFNLTAIAPSVVPQGNNYGTPVGKNPFDFANFQVGGSFANQSAEYLDGQPLNIGYINLPLILPTQDSISEFKVQYNNLGPDWGKFSGGVINLSTKSGSNEWHGSVYEYLRNKVLNANEFFANKAGIERPPFTQNQYGATVGGAPIKDKLFAFFSWESFRLRQGTVFTTTVPTLAERGAGPSGNFDFSDLCVSGFTGPGGICADKDTSGNFIHQIYDPLTVNTSTKVRQPFAGNIIPADRINPTSKFLFGLIPNPTNSATVNNFVKAAGLGGDSDEYVPRIDYNINSKQRIFGRYSYWKLADLPRDPFGTGLCQDRCSETYHTHALALGYSYAITPTTTADLNVSASRFTYLRKPINAAFDVTQEGWPEAYNAAVPDIERTPMTPAFGISDPLITNSQGQSAISDKDTQYNFSPRLTLIRGKHTFAMGAQFELSYDNYLQTNTGGGLISFNGTWTQDKAAGSGTPGTGIDFADFILGFGLGVGTPLGNQTSGAVNISGPVAGKQFYRAVYFGDTWKVTRKLTLNLGLRYDLQGPWSERFDRLTYFDPGVANLTVTGCGGSVGSPCRGDLFLVKTGANGGRNNLPLDTKNIMPRLGGAYSLDQKTVIRAGFGIFFIPNFVSFGVNPYIDPVSSSLNPFFGSNDGGLTPASTLHDSNCTLSGGVLTCATPGPFGPTLVPPPGRNPQPSVSAYALRLQDVAATGFTVQKNGSVQQWNLDLQRELPAGFFVDVAYAGAHGVHLPQFDTNINQIPDSLITAAAAQAAQGLTPTIAQVVPLANYPFSPALSGSLAPGNLKQGQLDRPFPQYTRLRLNGQGCCGSNYHSLQTTLVRRFSGGGTMLVAYTNAKLLANTDSLTSWLEGSGTGGVAAVQDWNNLKAERSLASQDVSQRLVISYVLDLPFGRGKKFMGDVSGVKDKLVSGWGIDGVTIFQRGFPLKIVYGSGTPLSSLGLGIGTLRPNVVPGCKKGTPSGVSQLNEWFNTACFTKPPDWGFGDESRVDPTLRQKGVNNFDFAIFKRTTFGPGERMNIEFRTEFFNLFNHPQFAAPNTTQVSPNFGVVTATLGNPRLVQFGLKFAF
jgi:Carboxypeptidase regulatory-like domain